MFRKTDKYTVIGSLTLNINILIFGVSENALDEDY